MRDEKVKLIQSIRPFDLKHLHDSVVRAQYQGYLDEPGVKPDSTTETYVAAKLMIDNWRWSGVPFYLRSGKKLAKRKSEIAIVFKTIPHSIFAPIKASDMQPDTLVLKVQPDEGIPKTAMAVKMLRSSLLAEMKHDYVRTAYSRGNDISGVLYGHVLKNAFLPVLTFFGMALADIFTGSIVVEKVFNIPGLGRILMTSISNRDYPVVEAIIMMMALVVIVTNLCVDLIYRKIDPRITVE